MKAATLNKQCSSGPGSAASGATPGRIDSSHRQRRKMQALAAAPRLTAPVQADDGGAARAVDGDDTPGSGKAIPRVLHVDSDASAALVLSTLLVPEARVTHVTTLAEARHLLQTELFSLVVLDPGLSDGDGGALLPVLASTPLLVYSARQPDWREQPRPYLPKPWTSPRQLWSTISRMLGIAPGLSAGD